MIIVALLAGAALAAGAAPPIPQLPPELVPHVPRNLRNYQLVFLVDPAVPKGMAADLFVQHQEYMRGQFERGIYRLAGPLTDKGRIRGMAILQADSVEDARRIVSADPAVQAGVFDVEVHPAMFPSLEALKVEYPAK